MNAATYRDMLDEHLLQGAFELRSHSSSFSRTMTLSPQPIYERRDFRTTLNSEGPGVHLTASELTSLRSVDKGASTKS